MKFSPRVFLLPFILAAATSTFAQHLITTVPVGTQPSAIAVNQKTNEIYVANAVSGTVSVIDGTSNTVTTTITVGNNPSAVIVNPTSNTIYVNNATDKTLSIIDGSTNTVSRTVPLPFGFNQAVQLGLSKYLYVTDTAANTVHVVDLTVLRPIADVPVTQPSYVTVSPAGHKVYVTEKGRGVAVIDTTSNTVVNTFTVEPNTQVSTISVDPVTNLLYVTTNAVGSGNFSVEVLDANTGSSLGSTVALGVVNDVLALPGSGRAVATGGKQQGQYEHSLIFINGSTLDVTGVLGVGNNPGPVTYNTATRIAYVANLASNNVAVVGN